MLNEVWNQFPRGIIDKIDVDIEADAYATKAEVVVTIQNKHVYRCVLEPDLRVPEVFIAQLCALV